jgi:hypothetical protein
MEHACRNCGFDERSGQHMLMSAHEGNPSGISVRCEMPANEKPLAYHRVFISTHDVGKMKLRWTPELLDW